MGVGRQVLWKGVGSDIIQINTVVCPCVGLVLVIRPHRIFTADGLWLRNSSVVAEVLGAEAGPDCAAGVVLGALHVALLGHVDGAAGRAEEDALRKALSESTCRSGQS